MTGLALFTLAALTQGGTCYPAIMLISDRYPPERRGRAMGWLIASISLGSARSLMLSAQMLTLGGYRLAFLVTAGGTTVGWAVALAALRGTPNVIHSHRREHSFRSELARNRPAIRLITGYTFHTWELLGMWAWMPALLAAGLVAGGMPSITAVACGAAHRPAKPVEAAGSGGVGRFRQNKMCSGTVLRNSPMFTYST